MHDPEGKESAVSDRRPHEGYDITYTNYNYPRQTYAENFRLLVDVKDVPPLGFKGLSVRRDEEIPEVSDHACACGRNFIENDFLRVEANGRGEVQMKDKALRTGLFPLERL